MITVTLIVVMLTKGYQMEFNMCSPSVVPTNSSILIKALTCVTATVQSLTLVVIVVVYILLMKSVTSSQRDMQTSTSNLPILIQVLVITGSNILCWIPANKIYLASMVMDTFSIDLVVWTTIANHACEFYYKSSGFHCNFNKKDLE